MRVVFTPRAVLQLDRLHLFITEQSSERRADAYIGRIQRYCRNLGTFPERGARRDDLMAGCAPSGLSAGRRSRFVVVEEAVVIEGIYYGEQDFEARLRQQA